MGGKKKKGKKSKKGKKDEEEDLSTEKLYRLYIRKCKENGLSISRTLYEQFNDEENEEISKIHLHEEIGYMGAKCLMEALKEIDYKHCKSLRFWKCKLEDEGVRAIFKFLEINKSVLTLEIMEDLITPLGCEFIGNLMSPAIGSLITILKLDYNRFGSEGMKQLSKGISMNFMLTILSLRFCDIDADGAEALMHIVIFRESSLKDLDLEGNPLRNEGIITLCQGLMIAAKLEQITLTNTQFGESDDVLNAMGKVMKMNNKVKKWNLRENGIFNKGLRQLLTFLQEGRNVVDLKVPDRMNENDVKVLYETEEEIKAREKLEKEEKKEKTKEKKKKGKKKKGGEKKVKIRIEEVRIYKELLNEIKKQLKENKLANKPKRKGKGKGKKKKKKKK